jgi:hypothetical protein
MKIIIRLMILLIFAPVYSQTFQVDTLIWNGNIDNRINIVVLGDGFLESELGQFDQQTRGFIDYFYKNEPFANYSNYYNVFSIRVPSNVSGAASSPSQLIDNYFGSTFGFGGIDRLLVPTKHSTISSVLATNFPAYDQIIMLVNSTIYGGSGGWVATSSLHSSAGEIVLHEVGHSFASLADEYWAGDQYIGERANRTREIDSAKVRWKNWYGDFGIGIYSHGSSGVSAEWYRPHNNCKMRMLNSEFCSVCSETIITKIHSLTKPVDSFSPDTALIDVEDLPITFNLKLVKPKANTLIIEWLLNSEILEKNEDSLTIANNVLSVGANTLIVKIIDTTNSIRIDNYQNIYFHSINWTLDNDTPVKDAMQIKQLLYPNPSDDYIILAGYTGTAKIYSSLGIEVWKGFLTEGMRIDISNFSVGVYFVRFGNEVVSFIVKR